MVAEGSTREAVEVGCRVWLVAGLALLAVSLDVLEDALGKVVVVGHGLPPGWRRSIGDGVDEQACATFAQIFPVLLVAAVIEIGRIHRKLRRLRWFMPVVVAMPMGWSALGLGICMVGVLEGGVPVWVARLVVALALGAMVGVVLQLVMIAVTREVQDEEDAALAIADRLPLSGRLRVLLTGRIEPASESTRPGS